MAAMSLEQYTDTDEIDHEQVKLTVDAEQRGGRE